MNAAIATEGLIFAWWTFLHAFLPAAIFQKHIFQEYHQTVKLKTDPEMAAVQALTVCKGYEPLIETDRI